MTKISILTATYNRGPHLQNLYNSIIKNSNLNVIMEWLIMDDGSTDNTKLLVDSFIKENHNNLEIKYFFQENRGKMSAINNLMPYASGELLIECDSDDYLYDNAISTILLKYNLVKSEENIYALAFLKYDDTLKNIGTLFKSNKYKTTMFNLYFKDGLVGDKALVYISSIRKKYKYILESTENFCTEGRLHHEMDKKYNIICFNEPIMVCEYLNDGYSKNIKKLFKTYPLTHYEYFKEILNFDMKGVLLKKRLYAIKHYILFSYLTRQKHIFINIKGKFNKFLLFILFVPGYIKSWIKFRKV